MRRFPRRFMCWGMVLCTIVFLVAFFCPVLQNAASSSPQSVRHGRKIRVGYYALPNFQEYDAKNQIYRGYGYEYLLALAQYAGWEYDFVPVSYEQGLYLLENGQIDLMSDVEKTPARETKVLFSALAAGEDSSDLIVRLDSPVAYEDFAAFQSLHRVGILSSNPHAETFLAYAHQHGWYPQLRYFISREEVLQALAVKSIDAVFLNGLQHTNSVRTVAKFAGEPYYFAVSRRNTGLLQELNEAMREIEVHDPYFKEKIYEKYYGKLQVQQTVLTDAEQNYIQEHPTVTVAYDPDWYPISYRNHNGQFDGAMAKFYQKIAEKTGLKFVFQATDTFSDALTSFSRGETQMMAELPYDYSWAHQHHGRLTPPFTTVTIVAAFLPGHSEGKLAALPEGYYQQYLSEVVRKDPYTFKNYKNIEECLNAVLNGQTDCAILNSYQLEYYRGRRQYRDFSFKVMPGASYRLAAAVSDAADPRLYSILTKAIESLGTDEVDAIFNETAIDVSSRTTQDFLQDHPETTLLIFGIFIFLLTVVVAVLFYSRMVQKKNLQLKRANEARSQFFSNISHDMRTPLNGVIGFTELAMKEDISDTLRRYLQRIQVSGKFLLQLINDILDLSKMENRQIVLNLQPVEAKNLLENIIEVIQPLAANKKVKLIARVEPEMEGYLLADALRVQQIFVNLLSNAVKFTPEGGAVEFLWSSEIQGDSMHCMVIVRDTGIGISKRFMPRLYEAFSQEGNEASTLSMGTGLGLSIVKQLLDLMEGQIAVKSEKGQGTEFTVRLSLRTLPEYAPQQEKAVSPIPEEKGYKVLLCEDNEINMELAKLILESRGLEVICAENGQEGLELFAASTPGEYRVIFMDLRMPVMGGIEAARAIRQLPREDARSIIILAMTADANAEDIARCQAAGMDGHIAKPIDAEKLFAELEKRIDI